MPPARLRPAAPDELANAVATSSGLGSGLQSPIRKAAAAPVAAPKSPVAKTPPVNYSAPATEEREQKKIPIIPIAIGGGIVVLALVCVIIYLLSGHGPSTSGSTGDGKCGGSATASFCGVPIDGSKVIYVLDDANSIANDFDPLKAATFASIGSLGSGHKFAVILWNNGDEFAFPRDGLANASSDQVDALRNKLQDMQATGASHIRGALERAMGRAPVAIVIVTGKERLDDDDESAIASAKETAAGKIKFYAFTVGSAGENQFLKITAESTGAGYTAARLSSHRSVASQRRSREVEVLYHPQSNFSSFTGS